MLPFSNKIVLKAGINHLFPAYNHILNLHSVLKTFIHDPLVEWSKKGRGGSVNENLGEVVNEKALSHMNDIDRRLRGIVAKSKGLPLSIEGHVHYLIQV